MEIIYYGIGNTVWKKARTNQQDTLMLMKTIKTNKYAPLILNQRNEFDARSNAAIEFKVEFRTFIVSSPVAMPGDSISTFKLLIGKCSTSNINLWLKRIVRAVLKGSWMIWTGAREEVYNMMQPKATLEKLKKKDKKYAEEGSDEKQEDKDCINLRRVLQEEMCGDFMGFAENRETMRHAIIGGADYKDITQELIYSNFDSKAELVEEEKLEEVFDNQIEK
jgi:hypothetical protein